MLFILSRFILSILQIQSNYVIISCLKIMYIIKQLITDFKIQALQNTK